MSAHDGEVEAFDGKWWQFPPLRNALLAGLVAGLTFAAELWLPLPRAATIALYVFAILLGGLHWMREGLEGLLH